MTLRRAHLSDLPYLYDICHRTGYAGKDASGVVSDRWLLGHYFAAPYLVRDPGWCWVAADDEGPAGYLVTTPDSRGFCQWMNSNWLPAIRVLSSKTADSRWSPFESWLRRLVHEPAKFPDFVEKYPAHLHIDFLPRAQGQGLGPQILELFLDQARNAGLSGFHLGCGLENVKAQTFYHRLGFEVIQEEPGVIYYGLDFHD